MLQRLFVSFFPFLFSFVCSFFFLSFYCNLFRCFFHYSPCWSFGLSAKSISDGDIIGNVEDDLFLVLCLFFCLNVLSFARQQYWCPKMNYTFLRHRWRFLFVVCSLFPAFFPSILNSMCKWEPMRNFRTDWIFLCLAAAYVIFCLDHLS